MRIGVCCNAPLGKEKQGNEKVFSGYSEREKLTGRYKVSMETTGRDRLHKRQEWVGKTS